MKKTIPPLNPLLQKGLILSLFFSLLLGGIKGGCQTWPEQMQLSPDGRMLTIGGIPLIGFYDDTLIRRVYLNFSQPNYWSLLQANYPTKTDLPATMVVDNVTYDSVGVRFKGGTSYNQLPPGSQKTSFNITVDYVYSNQDIMGYETLNLNNCMFDESFLREVFYQHQIRKHIPSAKSNYVHLYINNQDWGLYTNVEQLNKTFLKEWFLTNDGANWRSNSDGLPGWGGGKGALNNLGNDTTFYLPYYELKSSDITNPWQKLVDLCVTIDTVSPSTMENVLNNYLDVDRTLWFLASEIAFTDDDGYVYKGEMDYYAYYEVETGRFAPLEYDGNTVMDPAKVTAWSPFYHGTDTDFPLLYRMLAVPSLRQRYLAHMRTFIKDELDTASANAVINNYVSMIDSLVQSDPKKIYTYAQFQSEISVLKNFISNRRNFLLANSEVNQTGPAISNVAYFTDSILWNPPDAMDSVNVTAKVNSSNGIDHVYLYYSDNVVGKFTAIPMYDDGLHNDTLSGDNIFGATLPGQIVGTWVRFYVEAAAANSAKTVSFMPEGAEHNVYIYQVKSTSGIASLVNSEDNILIYPNPTSGEFQIQLAAGNWQLASSQKQEASIEIYNVYGERVYSSIIHHPRPNDSSVGRASSIIHLEAPNGIYFLQVKSKEEIIGTGKIIIQ